MSLIPIGVTVAQAELLNLLSPIFIRARSIAGIVANVTVEEIHLDELIITEHPIEQGSVVTDHAYKRPAKVVLRVGWSNSAPQAGGDPNYVQDIYDTFLTLQANRELLQIITGKRIYQNMLIHRLAVTTDEKTENALMMTCDCQEALFATTQTVTVPSNSVQATPGVTGSKQMTGGKQLQPAPNYNESQQPAGLQ